MKKILIVLLFVSTKIFAQQTIENEYSTFIIPNGLINVSKNLKKKTIQNQENLINLFGSKSLIKNQFTSNSIIKFLVYNEAELIVKHDYLEARKKMFDEMAIYQGKKMGGYSSVIKTYKNKSILILKNEINEYISFAIFSVNNSYDKVLNSTIVILKADSVEGSKEVEKCINSIQFK